MEFDLKKLSTEVQHDDTAVEVAIRDRDNQPYMANGQPVVLLVVGEYSAAYRANERRVINKGLKDSKTGVEVDADLLRLRTSERTAGGVVGWKNVLIDGKEAAFSREGVLALFKEAPWVEKQVEAAIARHASFFSTASAG